MEEKELIRGNIIDVDKYINFGIGIAVLCEIFCLYQYNTGWEYISGVGRFNWNFGYMNGIVSFIVIIVCLILFKFIFTKAEITVTDKRVYGRVAFGKRVDLPLDSISSVGLGYAILKSISVATSSGVIRFALVRNHKEVYQEISKLLLERQNTTNTKTNVTDRIETEYIDGAEMILKYKKLLDSGVISQEEFDAKKRQILNL